MKRRTFIKNSSLLTLPLLINGTRFSALAKGRYNEIFGEGNSDRVLVLIKMGGGNDTLNTILPLEYYDNLAKVRSNILIPSSKAIHINDEVGLHPAMEGIRDVFEDGRLRIIRAVGYPSQNRSHFRSSDIWNTGSKSKEYKSTGWLGDYLHDLHPTFPMDYPNNDYPDPLAITISASAAENCQGPEVNYSFALTSTSGLSSLEQNDDQEAPDTCFGHNLEFMRESFRQANLYSERIKEAYEKGKNLSDLYPDKNILASRLKLIARLISGGLKTRIFVVSAGGYDTHSNQVEAGDVTKGRHALLLSALSDGIRAFQDDLIELGLEKRVLGMTHSEFGRRIRSNASAGTDHGDAVGMFVFGECVSGGLLGDNPEISDTVSKNEAVPYQFDFRTVYGSILVDWMGVSEDYVKNNLFEDFVKLPIISGCATNAAVDVSIIDAVDLEISPNPAHESVMLTWKRTGLPGSIILSDEMGGIIRQVQISRGTAAVLRQRFDIGSLPVGVYYLKVVEGHLHKVKRFIKV